MNAFLKHCSNALRYRNYRIILMTNKETLNKLQVRHKSGEMDPKPALVKTLGVAAIIGAICYGTYRRYVRETDDAKILRERKRVMGEDMIGGEFELVDHKNRKRKSADYIGKWLLIFFGYTNCKESTSGELEKMMNVLSKLDKVSGIPKVTPLFITVDPTRDTPDVMAKYVKDFSAKLTGLTGSIEEVANVCKAYHVQVSPVPKETSEDYRLNYTVITFLVNPHGEVVEFFEKSKTADGMKNNILMIMSKYGHVEEKKKNKLWQRN